MDVFIYHESNGGHASKRIGTRIAEVHGKPDIHQIIHDVMDTRDGKIAICVCAVRPIRYKARETVARNVSRHVRYFELDYQPAEPQPALKRRESLPFQCRGVEGE